MAHIGHVLVADDELTVDSALVRFLSEMGYSVSVAASVDQAKKLVSRGDVDVALVDVDFLNPQLIARIRHQQLASGLVPSVPEEGAGFELTRWIRGNHPDTWVIQMSHHRTYAEDQIEGFSNGADAFFEKIRGPQLAASIVGAVLQRRSSRLDPSASFGQFRLSYRLRQLTTIEGAGIPLTDAEYRLLELLTRNPNRSLSKEMLHRAAFIGEREGEWDRAVDNLVLKLRKKLSGSHPDPDCSISTIQGVGYRLDGTLTYGS